MCSGRADPPQGKRVNNSMTGSCLGFVSGEEGTLCPNDNQKFLLMSGVVVSLSALLVIHVVQAPFQLEISGRFLSLVLLCPGV